MCEDKLKKAKIKLFKSAEGLKFFGILSQKFNYHIIEEDSSVEGYVQFKEDTKDIYLNKIYLEKNEYTHDNLIALIIHEILHILFKHNSGKRKENKVIYIWNLACDHVVEKELKKLNLEPFGGYRIIEEYEQINPNPRAEDVYEWLLNNSNSKETKRGKNFIEYKIKTKKDNNEYKTIVLDKDDTIDEKEEKRFLAEATSLKEILKDKGNIPGKLVELLDELLKVEIPWDELLDKSIKTKAPIDNSLRCWKKPSIYFIPHNIIIPSELPEDEEQCETLYISIDTSASISKEELKKFADIVNQSINYYKKIELIIHDTNIKEVRLYNKNDNRKFIEDIKKLGFSGRGGTSHKEVFEYVNKKYEEYPELFSLYVSLTDGYSDIENNMNLLKDIESIFLIKGSYNILNKFKYDNITCINIY